MQCARALSPVGWRTRDILLEGGEVEFTFVLSQVSGPQREHSSYVKCMCGWLRVTTFCCLLLLTCVSVAFILLTATTLDGQNRIIMLRKKYEHRILRDMSIKCVL
jgi:hypothetical protein